MISWSGWKCFVYAALLYLLSRRIGGGRLGFFFNCFFFHLQQCDDSLVLFCLECSSSSNVLDVYFLDTVSQVDHLEDLPELLEKQSPLMVAVTGSVASATPIKCERSDILAVILEETEETQFLKRNWKFSWVQDTATIRLPITNEVPWYLEDGTGRVNVSGAESALGFALTVGSEVSVKPDQPSSLVYGTTLHYLQGLKILGVRRFEYILPIGTWLTVVGEAVKDGSGNVRIQKPDQGPFYISPKPLDQLIPSLGKWSRIFKYASMVASLGLTVCGVIITSKPVIEYILYVIEDILVLFVCMLRRMHQGLPVLKSHSPIYIYIYICRRGFDAAIKYLLERTGYILERRRLRLLRNRYVCFHSLAKRQTRCILIKSFFLNMLLITYVYISLSLSLSLSPDVPDLCVICLDRKCDAVFVQCGHMCCCLTCSEKLQGKPCPLCRKPVVVLKIYRL
ncbi:hypothetical protein Bca52824_080181 [Brassica carinata]|uniref:RING-type E3 ubiquitin transferase n=1 Tax=Brassica carinata TaxID=52824 RepID=A0A8X7Q0N2_BRACI|nr:hypothetical protein Bca52824_080181 [Brassica carinata]